MNDVESDNPARLFCFGLGFSAKQLAGRLATAGYSVAGTCRDADTQTRHQAAGITAHLFNGSAPSEDTDAWLDGATHVLLSVPPKDGADPVLAHLGDALANCATLKWLGYLSTTGVYGNTNGARVDETAPLNADVPRSRDRVNAEAGWQELAEIHNLPLHIFRLAGIYGPGRNQLETVKAGKARRIDKPGHKFSRIHVDDIAGVLLASINRPCPGAIYNVCDDEPAEPARVVEYACELLGMEPPAVKSFEEASQGMSPMGLSFWRDNRQVDNGLIKNQLGVTLEYPTYREGLAALAKDMS